MTDFREIPDPGVYRNVLPAHYHGWDALSSSRLKILADRTPAHLLYHMANPDKQTPSRVVGSAIHARTLEPEMFFRWYAIHPPGNKNSNAYKDAKAAMLAENPYLTFLNPDAYDNVNRAAEAVWAHPAASRLLESAEGNLELSIVWQFPITVEGLHGGPICKSRLDVPTPHGIWDIKTTADASAEPFGRDAWNYRYDRQLAFYGYARALSPGLIGGNDHGLIAVEKEPPYGVAVYRVPGALLTRAEAEIDDLIEEYVIHAALGDWPAYPGAVQELAVPPWALKAIDRAAE